MDKSAAAVREVLVLCATHRDRREFARIAARNAVRFHFHDYASLELEQLAAWLPTSGEISNACDEVSRVIAELGPGLHAVVSTDDYPGSLLAAVIASRLGLPGVAPVASLRCQHKYLARLAQRRLVPEAVPSFALVDHRDAAVRGVDFPMFVKPVKSFFSIGGSRVDSRAGLEAAVATATLPAVFYQPLEEIMGLYPEAGLAGIGPHTVIAESLLHGRQCTLEGYVWQGSIAIVGVVDSVFYPGTGSFQRFEYPSSLPREMLARLDAIATRLMQAMDYGDGFFNIEFMVDPPGESVHIIEVNPRLASQFADLYEKVDGSNTYEMLLDISLGKPPARTRGAGRHRMAASCALRLFEDAYVRSLPPDAAVELLQEKYPDMRIELLATAGARLSQEMQDGQSFRYAILSIGAGDRTQLLRILDECVGALPFDFAETGDTAKRAIS